MQRNLNKQTERDKQFLGEKNYHSFHFEDMVEKEGNSQMGARRNKVQYVVIFHGQLWNGMID